MTLYNFANAERLALIRQQRADAAKKREEEKAGTSPLLFVYCFMVLVFLCHSELVADISYMKTYCLIIASWSVYSIACEILMPLFTSFDNIMGAFCR
jgi:hypothetical protein